MIGMSNFLEDLSVADLESRLMLNKDSRRELKEHALEIAAVLDRKRESERVSKILGRDVQVLGVESVESTEAIGDISAA